MVTAAASALAADSYFPITGKKSAVVSAGLGAKYLPVYCELIESTVAFFFASHVCWAFTDTVSKHKTIPPIIPIVFFINIYFK
jgi:hypothetical protein